MRAEQNEIDSKVLGAPVFDLIDFSAEENFAEFERQLIDSEKPRLLCCKVPIEQVAAVQSLEKNGFEFLEVQFRSTFKIKQPYDVSSYPYDYSPVGPEGVEAVADLAAATFTHDRYSVDPALPENAGAQRYRAFVEKSAQSDNEFVYKLVNRESREIVGFHSYAHEGGKAALFYLAGVSAQYKSLGIGTILNFHAINEMYQRGIRRITTHQSAANYPILNLEIGHFGFRITQAFVVLRKIYDE